MQLQRLNSFSENSGDKPSYRNLNVLSLEENTEYCKLCFLYDYRSGVTKMDKGFFTFFVKDENGNTLPARMFDLSQFQDDGFKVMLMKSHPVELHFIAQIFNGEWSLIVKSIELWDGYFDYEKFLGRASWSGEVSDVWSQSLEKPYNAKFETENFYSVCGGRVGGFASLLEKSWEHLRAYRNEELEFTDLQRCFFICMDSYFKLLQCGKKFEIVPLQEKLKIVEGMSFEFENDTCLNEAITSFMALAEMGKPEHLFNHLIYDAVKNSQRHLDLIYKNQILPFGARVMGPSSQILVKY